MPSDKATEQKRRKAALSLLRDMETTAERMRALILPMPPLELLGYIYAQYMLKEMSEQDNTAEESEAAGSDDLINENQFLLEYVHAVLASAPAPEAVEFDEARCAALFELSRDLKRQAMLYAIISSLDTKDGIFGPNTAEVEFRAKSTWVLLRGNRYQVLEGEFYRYVLAPHNDVLKEVYGISADEIAAGFQALADATRSGQADAITEMMKQFDAAQAFASLKQMPLGDVVEAWAMENQEQAKAVGRAMEDVLMGGITNVSRHTKLPPTLLADLAYQRGEETEFFAPGDYAGTPYRTLPARKKPLIQLGSDYYAVDPCFARDAGYRALLFNLLRRKPAYKQILNKRQKEMSEAAFADILSDQLPEAKVFNEIYYKDTTSGQWSENDTLILIDDVLFLVEAKAGAAATIASPELDFSRHAQSVQDLVIKAYKQCQRFFDYLHSSKEVSLYQLADGKYSECVRIRHADYRSLFPVGLTVESFSPFSSFCKELPQIEPLLGKHAFVSLAIDDLFVLKRFLPTPGEFVHYMEVRQSVAGIRGAHLFDEFDHLGAYLRKNRFDQTMADQLRTGKTNIVVWDGMSQDVDRSFEGDHWEAGPFPAQTYSEEIAKLLHALDATRAPGWLLAESRIRNLGDEGRNDLEMMLVDLSKSLVQNSTRYFLYGSEEPFFVWFQRQDEETDWKKINDKASAAALCVQSYQTIGIIIEATSYGIYKEARAFTIEIPSSNSGTSAQIFDDAEKMRIRTKVIKPQPVNSAIQKPPIGRKPGRNEPCPCQSGLKYKKCHGR